MIAVTRLNGVEFKVNPHMIEIIENNPDTTLIMLSGKRLVVKEDYETLYRRIIEYRKELGAFGHENI